MALVGAMAAAMMANQVTSSSARNSARQAARNNQERNQGRRVVGSYINGDGKNMTLLEIETNAVLDIWSEHIIEMQTWARSKGWEFYKYKNRYLYLQRYNNVKLEGEPQREDFPNNYKAWEDAYVLWRSEQFKKFIHDVLPTYEHYDSLIRPYVEMYSLDR